MFRVLKRNSSIKKRIFFSYFSTKTYVIGTQKNRLNEAVLLSTKSHVQIEELEIKIKQVYAKIFLSGSLLNLLSLYKSNASLLNTKL